MINSSTSINDLPPEILKHTLSFLEINDLGKASLISSSFDKIVKESIWEGIFNYSGSLKNFVYSEKRKDWGNFFYLVNRNYSLKAIENLIINLFNNPSTPTICKLKMIYYGNTIQGSILPKMNWQQTAMVHGLIPKTFKPFNWEIVPHDFDSKLHVSDKNTFKTGELVAVFASKNHFFNSTFYFGKIDSYRYSIDSWDVILYLSIKTSRRLTAGEIGKFPKDCELPSFCSM